MQNSIQVNLNRVTAEAGELSFPSFVEVDIESMSPMLMSEAEIDFFFDRLREETEKARAEAKARLKS
jgi:hypothetical protein